MAKTACFDITSRLHQYGPNCLSFKIKSRPVSITAKITFLSLPKVCYFHYDQSCLCFDTRRRLSPLWPKRIFPILDVCCLHYGQNCPTFDKSGKLLPFCLKWIFFKIRSSLLSGQCCFYFDISNKLHPLQLKLPLSRY